MIEIATKTFPFDINIDSYSYLNEDFFEDNNDFKISFKKRIKSKNNKILNINFDICKDEFLDFYTYIILDTDSTKKLFYINVETNGIFSKKLADIISYPVVKFVKNSYFNISFSLAIIENIE